MRRREGAEQLLALGRGRVVGLVVAVECPHRLERSPRRRCVDDDRYRFRLSAGRGGNAKHRAEQHDLESGFSDQV